jgi:glycosyltransferase involved in cell wall biosynthesis
MLTIEKGLERATDGLIFESAFALRVYRERAGEPAAPFRVIPNGMRAADFAPHAPRSDAADFLFIGELRPVKGIEFLLEALASPALAGANATIVGSGPSDEALKSRAAALGLSHRVRFTGALPAREAFAMGRIMVVPSLAESFPYVVLEAAAAGLPLIATSVGGIPEIVADTDTPLIEAGSAAALEDAMTVALEAPDVLLARAARLRAKIGRKFTVSGMTDAVLGFYANQFLTMQPYCAPLPQPH